MHRYKFNIMDRWGKIVSTAQYICKTDKEAERTVKGILYKDQNFELLEKTPIGLKPADLQFLKDVVKGL